MKALLRLLLPLLTFALLATAARAEPHGVRAFLQCNFGHFTPLNRRHPHGTYPHPFWPGRQCPSAG